MMKTKVTLTIDEDLVPEAKRVARSKGVSLSELVERSLRHAVRDAANVPPFSARWRGKFTLEECDEARFRQLTEKYR
jgi:antitoxin component of RelBE/YafQ-DinJ toxin-antitoxin module